MSVQHSDRSPLFSAADYKLYGGSIIGNCWFRPMIIVFCLPAWLHHRNTDLKLKRSGLSYCSQFIIHGSTGCLSISQCPKCLQPHLSISISVCLHGAKSQQNSSSENFHEEQVETTCWDLVQKIPQISVSHNKQNIINEPSETSLICFLFKGNKTLSFSYYCYYYYYYYGHFYCLYYKYKTLISL